MSTVNTTTAVPAVAISTGVYLDAHNYSALVFRIKDGFVYYVANEDKAFEVHVHDVETFAHNYPRHLPAYPVRRCARVYKESLFAKSDNANKVINYLLRSDT